MPMLLLVGSRALRLSVSHYVNYDCALSNSIGASYVDESLVGGVHTLQNAPTWQYLWLSTQQLDQAPNEIQLRETA